MSTVGFGPNCKVILLQFAEARVGEEDLQELGYRNVRTRTVEKDRHQTYSPNVRGGGLGGAHGRGSVREADSHGLVDVKP